MAKKKAAKKAAPKKPAKVVKMKTGNKGSRRFTTPTAPRKRTASPRSQTLPGMEQVRNKDLDRICEEISDAQRDINKLESEVEEFHSEAQDTMERDKVTTYRNSGVELALVTGGTKLRVRLLKDKTEKSSTSAATPGSGQDAGATLDEMTEPVTDDEGEAE